MQQGVQIIRSILLKKQADKQTKPPNNLKKNNQPKLQTLSVLKSPLSKSVCVAVGTCSFLSGNKLFILAFICLKLIGKKNYQTKNVLLSPPKYTITSLVFIDHGKYVWCFADKCYQLLDPRNLQFKSQSLVLYIKYMFFYWCALRIKTELLKFSF